MPTLEELKATLANAGMSAGGYLRKHVLDPATNADPETSNFLTRQAGNLRDYLASKQFDPAAGYAGAALGAGAGVLATERRRGESPVSRALRTVRNALAGGVLGGVGGQLGHYGFGRAADAMSGIDSIHTNAKGETSGAVDPITHKLRPPTAPGEGTPADRGFLSSGLARGAYALVAGGLTGLRSRYKGTADEFNRLFGKDKLDKVLVGSRGNYADITGAAERIKPGWMKSIRRNDTYNQVLTRLKQLQRKDPLSVPGRILPANGGGMGVMIPPVSEDPLKAVTRTVEKVTSGAYSSTAKAKQLENYLTQRLNIGGQRSLVKAPFLAAERLLSPGAYRMGFARWRSPLSTAAAGAAGWFAPDLANLITGSAAGKVEGKGIDAVTPAVPAAGSLGKAEPQNWVDSLTAPRDDAGAIASGIKKVWDFLHRPNQTPPPPVIPPP